MTNYRWAIEQVEISLDESEAVRMLIGLAHQGGYLGGRILRPSPEKPDWRVQVFFENDGVTEGWLPDGCHYRITPYYLLNATS